MIDVNNLTLFHLPEPKLTFGYNQRLADPRDGLTLFGAFYRERLKGQINVGVIGPARQRQAIKSYLQSIHKPVLPDSPDIARPYFPGLEAVFGIFINFSNLKEVDVSEKEIGACLEYSDPHQRIHRLCNLYVTRLTSYQKQEEMPVSVWFVAISDAIYTYGRPRSRIPTAQSNIRARLTTKERQSSEVFLLDEFNKLRDAYAFEANFHNQLKAKLLEDKIITQIIKESTVGYRDLWNDEKRIEAEKKFDTAKAWNIATTLYYKAGGLPWKLGDVRRGVCYLGLVYKQMAEDNDDRKACCAARMFLDSGDGLVFRGNIGPWYNPKTKEYHLEKTDAYDLLSRSLESFKDRPETGNYPAEVFIHAKTYFDDEEWAGFTTAANGKSCLVGVRIRDDSPLKLYRDFSYCVPRGTVLKLSSTKAHLWTKGFIPRLQTQLGLETPNSLEIEITRGAKDIKTVCADVLALTKLNYNSCIFGDGLPVTLRFADRIGEILTAGRDVEPGVLPFKHYV